jgi:hypothetical protein
MKKQDMRPFMPEARPGVTAQQWAALFLLWNFPHTCSRMRAVCSLRTQEQAALSFI